GITAEEARMRVRRGGPAGGEALEPALLVGEEGGNPWRGWARRNRRIVPGMGGVRLAVTIHGAPRCSHRIGRWPLPLWRHAKTRSRSQRDGAPRPPLVASEGKAEVYVL